ncbi:recombinase family protein [Propionibacterium freudenreichii]|uniref:recombinase family protein n=1 Tax=Propionibacterium freudenreichii TaxID=1744 RepID=UPI00254C67C1|nr:recombinase family protein [Propionibacterium freudenreichii]
MIQYVKANKVSYCIVHKVDRLARNRADDVSIHLALQQCGVMLVSATENIDETPSGMLLHGIMSTIAEFYSRNLATEVTKGMTQKAIGGGTNGRAPIGYLNVRKRDEMGRELRTIELDPERAPMIEWAFKAYASGNWSVSQLHDELTSRGLRSLPTPKRPAKPLAVSTIHRLLTNPYYKGDVVYRGTRYKGNHPALVPAEVWYQVQSVLTAHQCAVEATQVHGHYLKGTIHCGQCGSRLIVSNAKNRHGNVYCYFVCSGRHSKRTDCTRQAMLIEDVEKLVEDYYTRVQITPAQQDALAGMLHHEFDRLMAAETEELERLITNRDRLESEQDRLMQAHYADAIPLSVLKREQDRIVAELDQVTRRIDAHFGDYADARAHLDDALGLLANCADIYTRCDDTNRRLCNQAFFTKVYIDEDNELRVEHNRPFEMLLDPQVNANALTWAADVNKARTSANVSIGKGSSLVRAVDLAGGLSKLAPPEIQMVRAHQSIRAGRHTSHRRRRQPQRAPRASEDVLQRAEAAYAAGGSLKAVARQVGLGHERLSRLLRERGVVLRHHSPSSSEIRLMRSIYEQGASLERVGDRFGYTAGTVRIHLIIAGVVMRDTHGRGALPKVQQAHR